MMIYNDFPTLTEKQYQEIMQEYDKKFASTEKNISEALLNTIHCCKNSLHSFTKVNRTLRDVLKNNSQSLGNILETLALLYPKTKIKDNTILNNLFNILEELANALTIVQQLKTKENKTLYTRLLQKVETQIIKILCNTLNCLSKQSLRFFEHI